MIFTVTGLKLSAGRVISMIFSEMLSLTAEEASCSQLVLMQLSACIAMLSVLTDCRFVEHAIASMQDVRARSVFDFRRIRVV